MKMLSAGQSNGLITSSEFYRELSAHFGRRPSTMRKACYEKGVVKPSGFKLIAGTAVNLYSQESVLKAVQYFKLNPPLGSGRPKGSTKKVGKS